MTTGRCYRRDSGRKSPHNLVLDPSCVLDAASSAGTARSAWIVDDAYAPQGDATDPFVFVDSVGAPIPLASGTTFIELARS